MNAQYQHLNPGHHSPHGRSIIAEVRASCRPPINDYACTPFFCRTFQHVFVLSYRLALSRSLFVFPSLLSVFVSSSHPIHHCCCTRIVFLSLHRFRILSFVVCLHHVASRLTPTPCLVLDRCSLSLHLMLVSTQKCQDSIFMSIHTPLCSDSSVLATLGSYATRDYPVYLVA